MSFICGYTLSVDSYFAIQQRQCYFAVPFNDGRRQTKLMTQMKKFFIVVAVLAAFGTSAINAETPDEPQSQVTTAVEENFKEIKVEELPEAVKNTIAEKHEGKTIKAAYVNATSETKTYKVTLTDAENNSTDVLLNEKGEVLPEK